MAKPTSPPTSRRKFLRRRGVLAVSLVAAVALLGTVIGGDVPDDGVRKRRGAIEAYQANLLPIVQEWGRIEVQGMRPAIGDLETGDGVPPETVAGEARAWRAGLESLRSRILSLDPPESLEAAERLFDDAIQRYLDATHVFERAADGPAAERKASIEKGIAAVTQGTRLYNEASLVLQAARKEVGLPPTEDFPNHPAGREDVSEDVNGPSG